MHSSCDSETEAQDAALTWRLWLALQQESSRADLAEARLAAVHASRSWRLTAPLRALLERFGNSMKNGRPPLRSAEGGSAAFVTSLEGLPCLPTALVRTLSGGKGSRLFVDVTQIDLEDLGAGIQRVTRCLLSELALNAPPGYSLEPVRLASDGRYQSARRFMHAWLGLNSTSPPSESELAPASGDVFIGLDFLREHADAGGAGLAELRRAGAAIVIMAYDTLPIDHPDWFPPVVVREYEDWLGMVSARADRVICISEATRDSFARALASRELAFPPAGIGVVRLGGDAFRRIDCRRLPPKTPGVTRVCMVGTIEPRKGHDVALSAFEALWSSGERVELIIAGRAGWHVAPLLKRLRDHPELGRRLFWIEGGDDATIAGLYQSSDLLVMASHGEGHGLPVVEAAHFHCALLLRDLPVFREIAGYAADYFEGGAMDLEFALRRWLDAPSEQRNRVDAKCWPSWADAATDLIRDCHALLRSDGCPAGTKDS